MKRRTRKEKKFHLSKTIANIPSDNKKNNLFYFFKLFLLFLFSVLFSFFIIFSFKKIKLSQEKLSIKKEIVKKKLIETKIDKNKLADNLKLIESFYFEPTALVEFLKNKRKGIQLVDTRDIDSFKKEHLKGAVYFSSIDNFKKNFSNKKLTFVVYGNYSSEKRPIEVAYELISIGFKVKVLTVGYNEFRHLKIYWLPQSQWDKINPADFIEK